MQEDLKKLGLTENEIKVYISLLHLGETQVGGIINDLKIHRQIAYNAFDSLEKKNMVIKTMKNKVYHYQISDPGIILENIKKQELIARRIQDNIKKEMKKNKREQEINVYSGRTQLRNFYLNTYKNAPENTIMYGLHSFGKEYIETMGEDFLEKLEKIRQKKHMLTKHIASETRREDMIKTIKTLDNKTREVRFISYDMINPISTLILNNTVWFQSFYGEDPFIIEIKNEQFYMTFLNHFEELWKIAKK
jgi:sugar-specific transcriptional regulator TrmB